VVPARVAAAHLAAAEGDADAVVRHVAVGRAIMEGRLDAFYPELAVGGARALHRVGAAGPLRDLAAVVAPPLRNEGTAGASIGAALAEGFASLADGAAAEAAEQLRRARDLQLDLGAEYSAAVTGMDLAEALAAAGDETGAAEARERARTVLEPLGVVRPI
jgi:hypothetical protein